MRPNSNNKLITRLQINKTEKSFSLIGCAINDKSYKYENLTARCLPDFPVNYDKDRKTKTG